MTKSQEVHGDVEMLIGRDAVTNVILPSPTSDDRPLVPAQRRQLNQLVKSIAEISGEDGSIVWPRVHATLGVISIEEITISQYSAAEGYLQAQLDKHREQNDCKSLVHQLLKQTTETRQREALLEFCRIQFGSAKLVELNKSQLQQALAHLHLIPENESTPAVSTPPVINQPQPWQSIIRQYPLMAGAIFLSGFIVGYLI